MKKFFGLCSRKGCFRRSVEVDLCRTHLFTFTSEERAVIKKHFRDRLPMEPDIQRWETDGGACPQEPIN